MSFLFPFFFLLLLFFIVPFLVYFLFFLAFIILTDSLNLSRLRFSKVDAPSVGSLFASRFSLEVGYLVSACVTRVSSPFVCLSGFFVSGDMGGFLGGLFAGLGWRFSYPSFFSRHTVDLRVGVPPISSVCWFQ